MNTYKKTIFLSNKDNSQNKAMGILTLEKKNNTIFGTFKTFNYSPAHDLVLGLKYDDKIIKQNIILNNNYYNFMLNNDFDITKSLGCVLLECDKASITPILWGNEKNINYKNQIVNSMRTSIEKIKQLDKNTTEKEQNTIEKMDDYNEYSIPPIKGREVYEIHKETTNKDIEKYAQISMESEIINPQSEIAQTTSMESLFESSAEEIEESIDKELLNHNISDHKFYNMIADQMEELFSKYPRETNLEKIIDNSKWVKINHEEENKYYVVGLIYVDGDIKYVCYGVPGSYYNEPPRELLGYSQWLPTDTLNPYDNGYWVMYQDSDTGENIYIN